MTCQHPRATSRMMLLISLSIGLTAFGCGGGGGGGSTAVQPAGGSSSSSTSASSSSSTQSSAASSFSYDKILGSYTGKSWDAFAVSRTVNYDSAASSLVSYQLPDNFSITQTATGYDLEIGGTWNNTDEEYSYDFNISESNSNISYLYDPNGVQMSIAAARTFSDATMRLITYDLDYLAGLGVEYADSGWIQIDWTNKSAAQTDIFPAFYGSYTQAGDFPTSGTKTYRIKPYLFVERWAQPSTNTERAFSEGLGELTVNFATNAVEGSITLSRYYDYDQFLASGTDYSQLLGYGELSLVITEGTFNPSNGFYNATLSINQENQDGTTIVGSGNVLGYLMGPEGVEIGGSFYIARDADNEQSSLWFWDSIGSFLGST